MSEHKTKKTSQQLLEEAVIKPVTKKQTKASDLEFKMVYNPVLSKFDTGEKEMELYNAPKLTPALKVPKKRGRPFKEDRADWDGETPPAPKRYKRTMTIPKLTEPIRNTKLRDLIKAIYRDGALGNDRSLQRDVDAIKELFT